MSVNPDWLVPDWPAPANVHAVFTTRTGGQSVAPFDSLNLGDHVGDQALAVAANRATLVQSLAAKPVFLSQVHGTQVERLTAQTRHGTQADACITDQLGLACTIMVADCLPVLLTDTQGRLVAAAHAGWRSLAGQGGVGVLEQVFKPFRALAPVHQAQAAIKTIAWLGPCIGPEMFEVGSEVRDIFIADHSAAITMFICHTPGKWLANLPGLARLRLAALGVDQVYGNDGSRAWCTVSNPSRFFSYRREGVTGRMAACIWRN